MAIELRIAEWSAQGLRCPDHTIRFVDDKGEVTPVSLLQMPNGTGKTTTLTLLRAALSGRHPNGGWDKQKVQGMRKKDDPRPRGQFQVALLQNGRRITITMDFDFEDGDVSYSTTLPSGMKRGFHPPKDLERFLRPEFVSFFVFDGELAEHLIDQQYTDAEQIIDDLFQLKTFVGLGNRVDEYWAREVEGRSAQTQKGHTRRANDVLRLKERIAELEARQKERAEKLERTNQEIEEVEKKFKDALKEQGATKEKVHQARDDLDAAEREVRRVTTAIVAGLKNPCSLSAAIGERLATLKNSLDQVRLPESAAREFFSELAEDDECVCGRPLDPTTREAIRERASRYLGSDDVAFLNAMKTQIADLATPDPAKHAQEQSGLVAQLKSGARSASQMRTRRDAIEAEAASGDPASEEAQQRLSALRTAKAQLEVDLRRFDDPTDTAHHEDTWGLPVLRKRLTEAEKALTEVRDTLVLKQRRDALQAILKAAHEAARQALGSAICSEANSRIAELMPDNTVRIDRIDRSLLLRDQESGSTGENLSVAYAFLSTLFRRADHSIPFVVDSPAGPIDLRVRAEVARLIPQLSRQFIAFTISSEREGFVPPLQRVAGSGTLQLLTLFRKDGGELEASARRSHQIEESADGMLVYGEDFFRNFHRDKEE